MASPRHRVNSFLTLFLRRKNKLVDGVVFIVCCYETDLLHYRNFVVTLWIFYYIIGKFWSYIIGAYFVTSSADFVTLSVVTLSVNLGLHYRLMLHYKALLHYRA